VAKRNPKWSRDELIITLDFYMHSRPSIPDNRSKEISDLSYILNQLQVKLGGEVSDTFRNPNGVYMKLMNFRRFDPSYEGKGLERGGKDEEVVWHLFSPDTRRLRETAKSIRSLVTSEAPSPIGPNLADDEGDEAEEGKILTRIHRFRERDTKLISRKKEKVLRESGALCCEVCGFNFKEQYGARGEGFIECHHTKPLSGLKDGEKTKLTDLAVVCSNCHRMIHRKRPWLSLNELKQTMQR
jgi:5-methylcytosine-specific restriction protein A